MRGGACCLTGTRVALTERRLQPRLRVAKLNASSPSRQAILTSISTATSLSYSSGGGARTACPLSASASSVTSGHRASPKSATSYNATISPTFFHTGDSDAARSILDDRLSGEREPVIILHDGRILVDPTNLELANALGARTRPSYGVYDVVVVGGGPAGLSAAVYAESEGLRTALIEPTAMGGQAGTSSMIRNYLGFPEASAARSSQHAPSTKRSFSAPK